MAPMFENSIGVFVFGDYTDLFFDFTD